MKKYKLTVFVEEGMKDSGFGEYASSLALKHDLKTKTLVLAVESSFFDEKNALGTRDELLEATNLDGKGIANAVLNQLSFIQTSWYS